jgi:hypothetical protein
MASKLASGERDVIYLYGISGANPGRDFLGSGIRGSRIQAITCQGLACWFSKVPAVEFSEQLADNMQNLDWVAETSVAHQRAVSVIANMVDLLPARLATIFRSEDSLVRHAQEHAGILQRDLARIKNAEEWGIKVLAVESPNGARGITKIRSGRDYLKAKAAMLPKARARSEAADNVSALAEALGKVAIESAPPGKVSSGQKAFAFQTSILVRRSDRKKLESILNKFTRQWSGDWTIECTGPWPPYSFVSRIGPD